MSPSPVIYLKYKEFVFITVFFFIYDLVCDLVYIYMIF